MTVKEVARMMGVKPSTVHSWIQAGWLAVVNPRSEDIGRVAEYRISNAALDAYRAWRRSPESRVRKPKEKRQA